MKVMEVVAGVITDDHNLIFCVQRGENSRSYISKKWEFPGGKIEAGESHEQALVRELKEELSIEVGNLDHFLTVNHTYPDFRLIMHVYTCKIVQGSPVLTEHLKLKWLKAPDLKGLDWAAADIPIVEIL
tara:strand:+ start:67 stop:453 length:387 start_codon:yes stop_codon:yes gene_type:complete